ncbi:hypothetical protein HDF08_003611 [Edaphobacter lichenicola]|uniref:Uncharacterized protein n=1 Tax=Tunturiibacter lichenicola TaxID=2051959 RepID=A0A852VJY9_9BACT|nr:hypothetical protein [Edaphobacter lichenicola]
MTVLASLISDYGWPAGAAAALIYVLMRSEIHIHYPGRTRKPQ